jgi:uncharacterized protein involved in type VI secretion and phage assembly
LTPLRTILDERPQSNLSEQTVQEIIIQIFQDFGFRDFKSAPQSSYEPREVVVQYRETECSFIFRLMEREGLFISSSTSKASTLL